MFTVTKNGRPVHLNLFQIKLPVPGIMSILHRVSGVLLSVAVPVGLYLLDLSLRSPEGYAQARFLLDHWLAALLLLGLFWGLLHHLFAGLRHLLLDVDVGIEKPAYRRSAWAVLLAAPPLALLLTWGVLA
jgi:succinate dehydrogenase / fumarate reductase cytochrome b subunit